MQSQNSGQDQPNPVPAPPPVSPDGRFWYDGERWVPLAPAATKQQDVGDAVAGGCFKFLLGLMLPTLILIVPVLISSLGWRGVFLAVVACVGGFLYWKRRRRGAPDATNV